MIAINSNIADPYLNHAVEEVLLSGTHEDCFVLWKNQPCLLIGKNQNTYSEINTEYVRANNIAVVRRPTGGGTVYNDDGNLNFTFITSRKSAEFADFEKFTGPVVAALRALGVPAEYRGRNDLLIDGKKFSGNAQCWMADKVLHHGTLLYNSDLGAMQNALNVSGLKLLSKSIKSVSARVTNISAHMQNPPDIYLFKDYLFEFIVRYTGASVLSLTPQQLQAANDIADAKYRLHSHNYGVNDKFDIIRQKKFDAGLIAAEINVFGGKIKAVKFSGDYFSRFEQQGLVDILTGIDYDYQSVLNTLQGVEDLDGYFSKIDACQLASVII